MHCIGGPRPATSRGESQSHVSCGPVWSVVSMASLGMEAQGARDAAGNTAKGHWAEGKREWTAVECAPQDISTLAKRCRVMRSDKATG